MSLIPYGRQFISQADIEAVTDVLKSDFLTQGPVVPNFEKILAETCNAYAACATNSATSALHIACLALGVGEGDVVWTSPISFVASANCARLCGANVSFVDIDPDTTNICVEALEEKLQAAFLLGKVPKVLIAVHMGGAAVRWRKFSIYAHVITSELSRMPLMLLADWHTANLWEAASTVIFVFSAFTP